MLCLVLSSGPQASSGSPLPATSTPVSRLVFTRCSSTPRPHILRPIVDLRGFLSAISIDWFSFISFTIRLSALYIPSSERFCAPELWSKNRTIPWLVRSLLAALQGFITTRRDIKYTVCIMLCLDICAYMRTSNVRVWARTRRLHPQRINSALDPSILRTLATPRYHRLVATRKYFEPTQR